MTQEIRKQAICSEETYFKSYRSLYERPAFRETLDCVDCTIYCLLADRYNFFASLEHHENQVKTRSGELAIRYSESKIAEYLQVSRYKVSLAIQKLEILGLIKVERTPGQASNYVVFDIPAEVPQERVAKVKELLGEKKQRNKKYNNKDLLKIEQDPKLAQNRATPQNLLNFKQELAQNRAGNDDDLLKMNTGTCSKLSNHLLKIEQVPAQNEYNNKTYKEKDLIKNPERGTVSPEGSACPPAVNNNTNDGISREAATINGEGLSLPSNQDNEVLSNMMAPSEQDTMLLPSNTGQTNDGINQKEQSPSSGPSQPGINNNSTTAASSQNLPEGYMLLKDWLPKNCRVQYVIDTVLAQLDGNIICPPDKGHSKEWAAIMPQIARALPHVRDLLIHLGYAQNEIDSVISYVRCRNGTATRVIGYFAPQSLYTKSEDSPLGVYVKADQWITL